MRLAFIENDDSFSWNVLELLPFERGEVEVVRGGTAGALLAAREADAVVIGPGPTDPVRAGLIDLVRLVVDRGVPLLGICLGHQAIGLAFGATLRRTPPVHGSTASCQFERSRLFPELAGVHEVMRYHSLSLEEVRSPLRVIARAGGLVMAAEHETLPIAGLQFHPDSYATPDGRRMVEAFFRSSGAVGGHDAPGSLTSARPRRASSRDAGQARLPVRLSELDRRESFVLLGPGFTEGWTLFDPLRAGEGAASVVLRPYSGAPPLPTWERGLLASAIDLELDVPPVGLPTKLDERGFLTGVEQVRAAIAAGDVYQVNLTQRATVTCSSGAQLLATLCRRGVPRFAAWVKLPGLELVSASPELLFALDGDVLRAEPMKGTAAPGRRAWLDASVKDKAELAMITDLLRDDLHRLCLPRSVRVANERRFIELPYALQTVSDVEGVLRDGVGVEEILAQLHPGGSVTGAPRSAACKLIAQLEPTPRGLYCGTLGLVEPGRARFALLIRSATRVGPDAWDYGVGGGITWASDAQAELEEVRLKLGALS